LQCNIFLIGFVFALQEEEMSEIKDRTKLDFVLDCLGLLRELGLTITPVNPSGFMVEAGAKAAGIDFEAARVAYDAMIITSIPSEPKETQRAQIPPNLMN